MFTLSKSSPDISFGLNVHLELGSKLQDLGGRILLICSTNPKDKLSIEKIKAQFKQFNITFIQSDQNKQLINRADLDTLQIRAEDFNVNSVVAIGDIEQMMSGRFISQRLSLNYFEIPTVFHTPYLLIPKGIFSNRVGNRTESVFISYDSINEIVLDQGLVRSFDDYEIALYLLSILLDLAQCFIDSYNNIVSKTESRNLFVRIINDLNNSNFNKEKLMTIGLTSALYHGASTNIELYLTDFSWLATARFNINPGIINAKLLPWLLDSVSEDVLALSVRDILHKLELNPRLTDLGFSLKQLTEINSDNLETIKIIEKAF